MRVTLSYFCFGAVLLYLLALRFQGQVDSPEPETGPPSCSFRIDPERVTSISDRPRIYHYSQFLSHWEREYLIRLVGEDLPRSTVNTVDGGVKQDPHRTSSGRSLEAEYDDWVVRSLEERIARWAQIPAENGEMFYYLRYNLNEEYKQHHDSFDPEYLKQAGISTTEAWGKAGPRVCTVLLYLQAPTEGGETEFPEIGLKIPIGAGDALMFWTYNPDNEWERRSLHAGLPVRQGEKIIITKWIRMDSFYPRIPLHATRLKLFENK